MIFHGVFEDVVEIWINKCMNEWNSNEIACVHLCILD